MAQPVAKHMAPAKAGRRGHPALVALLVLLALVVAYGVAAWASVSRVRGQVDGVRAGYEALREQIGNGSFEEALSTAREMDALIEQIRDETHGWQWRVAERLPLLGEDVAVAQQTSDVAAALASDAVMPVLEAVQASVGDVTKIAGLPQALQDARNVVDACKRQAQEISASHFDGLNKLVDQLRTATTSADGLFDAVAPLIDAAQAIGDIANMVGGQAAGQEGT